MGIRVFSFICDFYVQDRRGDFQSEQTNYETITTWRAQTCSGVGMGGVDALFM